MLQETYDGFMFHRNYDLAKGGAGFMMIAPSVKAPPEAIVFVQWIRQLRQKIKAAR